MKRRRYGYSRPVYGLILRVLAKLTKATINPVTTDFYYREESAKTGLFGWAFGRNLRKAVTTDFIDGRVRNSGHYGLLGWEGAETGSIQAWDGPIRQHPSALRESANVGVLAGAGSLVGPCSRRWAVKKPVTTDFWAEG